MSYVNQKSGYLIPNIPLATTDAGVLKEMDIGASSADHGEMICVRPCKVVGLQFIVVGEIVGGTTTAPTVVFTKRPTPLSATSESAIGTLTIPDTTAIGVTVYKEVTPVSLAVGDSVEISHTVGVGSPTGKGFWELVLVDDPEDPSNNTGMLESA
jgi:hypothetical protein